MTLLVLLSAPTWTGIVSSYFRAGQNLWPVKSDVLGRRESKGKHGSSTLIRHCKITHCDDVHSDENVHCFCDCSFCNANTTVDFHKHRVINFTSEGISYRFQVCLVAVRCKLNASGEPCFQIVNEMVGRATVTATNKPAGNKFCVG